MSLLVTRRTLFAAGLAQMFWQKASAHALPDSTLVFAVQDGVLFLVIEVPVVELRLALPALPHSLEDQSTRSAIAIYFLQHLSVQGTDAVEAKPTLRDVAIIEKSGDHVGKFAALRIGFVVGLEPDFGRSTLQMRYDAILHQVPNHGALVFWTMPDGTRQRRGRFAFDVFTKSVSPPTIILQP